MKHAEKNCGNPALALTPPPNFSKNTINKKQIKQNKSTKTIRANRVKRSRDRDEQANEQRKQNRK